MATKKVSVTLDEKLVMEIKTEVGAGGFSAYLNEVLRRERQRQRLQQFERELVDEYGPIPDEVQREIDSHEWPR